MFIFEAYIIVNYVIPLKVLSPYILLFFLFLTSLILFSLLEIINRLKDGEAGFYVDDQMRWSLGMTANHAAIASYILLGLTLSSMMYDLSVSLSLILNMCEPKEA